MAEETSLEQIRELFRNSSRNGTAEISASNSPRSHSLLDLAKEVSQDGLNIFSRAVQGFRENVMVEADDGMLVQEKM